MKKIIAISTLLTGILILLGGHSIVYASQNQPLSPDKIEFIETLSWELNKDYTTKATTDNAVYLFSDGTEDERIELILKAEIILSVSKREYGLQQGRKTIPNICFASDTIEPKVNFDTFSVELGSGSLGAGALFFYMSGGTLPAWLCTGIELYWLDKNGIKINEVDKTFDVSKWEKEAADRELPCFGDKWLIPGFINDKLTDDVPSAAYAFIKYLDNSGVLPELIELYKNDLYKFKLVGNNNMILKSEQVREDLWSHFTGVEKKNDNDLNFYYTYNLPINNVDVVFYILAEHAKYCLGMGEWNIENVQSRVAQSEEAIQFEKDWFGYEYDKMITVFIWADPQIGLWSPTGMMASIGKDIIYISADTESPLWYSYAFAHEVAHCFINRLNINSNFPYKTIQTFLGLKDISVLEEGLCNALAQLYVEKTEYTRAAEDSLKYLLTEYIKEQENIELYLQHAYKNSYDMNRVNAVLAADIRALSTINQYIIETNASLNDMLFWDGNGMGAVFESFVLYLLGQSESNADFLRAYEDINLMEDVYGKDLNEMFSEWLEYMEQYIGCGL